MFVARLIILAEIFQREFSDAALVRYFEALKDLPLEACMSALEKAERSNKFMPVPSELRALARGTADLELAADKAWLEYKRWAREVGGYESVVLPVVLARTIESVFGSWPQACSTEFSPEMWAAKRKEFTRVYRAMLEETPDEDLVTLDGRCARENRLRFGHDDWREVRGLPPAAAAIEARALLRASALDDAPRIAGPEEHSESPRISEAPTAGESTSAPRQPLEPVAHVIPTRTGNARQRARAIGLEQVAVGIIATAVKARKRAG